jgi:starch synthase
MSYNELGKQNRNNMMKKRKILFVSSESVPYVKTGGLADVSKALVQALRKRGHDVRLVIPRYWQIDRGRPEVRTGIASMGVKTGAGTLWCSVLSERLGDLPVYFIEHEGFFGRSGIYDDGHFSYPDNAERFAFFSAACLRLCVDIGFIPDIVHCNDWQTALVPAYLKTGHFRGLLPDSTASVLSIHNIGYQGKFPISAFPFTGLPSSVLTPDRMEDYGGINYLKAGIFYADAISTVSPSYAREILSDVGGNGLHVYLQRRRDDLTGILNGVDYSHWDPSRDELIPAKYSRSRPDGKILCKEHLQKEFALEVNRDIPVIGIVSRFAQQKGFQMLLPVFSSIVESMRVQFAVVGSGEKYIERFFSRMAGKYPGRVGAWIGYNENKAHLIEAGSDFFLMPSLYEPCGLNQIYSLKYGTLPIVRNTGGLKDTVEKYSELTGEGTGFSFDDPVPMALKNAVGWAVSTYYDRPAHIRKMRENAMSKIFCWDMAAEKYEDLYEKAGKRRRAWT